MENSGKWRENGRFEVQIKAEMKHTTDIELELSQILVKYEM